MKNNIFWIYILSGLIYFNQGIGGLPNSAFFFYMKETLGLDEQKIMFIGSIIGLAWVIKPVWGFFIDNLGLSKKYWILVSIIMSIILTLCLGFISFLPFVLIGMGLLSVSGAIRDVAIDGEMCCKGKEHGITGRIQSLQWIALTTASILVGVTGGWLADHTTYQMAYLLLVPFYIIMLIGTLQYKTESVASKIKINFLDTIKTLLKDKNLLLVCGFLFLFNFSPSIGTPLTFIQRDEFGWSRTFMGLLGTIGAIASLGGAWLYYHYSKYLDIKIWLVRSIWISAATTLCYLYYSPVSCVVYDIVFSVIGMFITLMVLDFMARETKYGFEAVSFALLCSVTNLTGTLNGFIGGFLLPIVGLKVLIVISALTSFLCLPLISKLEIKK